MKSKKTTLIDRGSTLFLRLAVIGLGLMALGLSALTMPAVYQDWAAEFPDIAATTYPILGGLAAIAVAFWIALAHAWKILGYIDKHKIFSQHTIKALYVIKVCLLTIAGFYLAGWPIIAYLAELDDAPGLILIYGAIFIGMPVVMAVAVAVFQRLLQSAIDIKSENDLTV